MCGACMAACGQSVSGWGAATCVGAQGTSLPAAQRVGRNLPLACSSPLQGACLWQRRHARCSVAEALDGLWPDVARLAGGAVCPALCAWRARCLLGGSVLPSSHGDNTAMAASRAPAGGTSGAFDAAVSFQCARSLALRKACAACAAKYVHCLRPCCAASVSTCSSTPSGRSEASITKQTKPCGAARRCAANEPRLHCS